MFACYHKQQVIFWKKTGHESEVPRDLDASRRRRGNNRELGALPIGRYLWGCVRVFGKQKFGAVESGWKIRNDGNKEGSVWSGPYSFPCHFHFYEYVMGVEFISRIYGCLWDGRSAGVWETALEGEDGEENEKCAVFLFCVREYFHCTIWGGRMTDERTRCWIESGWRWYIDSLIIIILRYSFKWKILCYQSSEEETVNAILCIWLSRFG